ncbi:MAG: pantoate--beta-alanine ligase [Myxococcales bacterium]|nr:MAG: pantoate--beta-alanine ligase [Myxococcales bacterium]
MTTLVREANEFYQRCNHQRIEGKSIAFVPTMGALHHGHLELVRLAKEQADICVVSIFVNPTQFGPKEDLALYPRTLDKDLERCTNAGVDTVFAPTVQSMYPQGYQTTVSVPKLATVLEGQFRPGHFDGVCTVVLKLFNLCGPCTAVFGRKDYQQFKIIERMVQDLNLPVSLIAAPIVRDRRGLALSSRNAYLDEKAYKRACAIPQALLETAKAFAVGQKDPQKALAQAKVILQENMDKIDYFGMFDPENMTELSGSAFKGAVVAFAGYLGQTRLIDNMVLGETLWTCT